MTTYYMLLLLHFLRNFQEVEVLPTDEPSPSCTNSTGYKTYQHYTHTNTYKSVTNTITWNNKDNKACNISTADLECGDCDYNNPDTVANDQWYTFKTPYNRVAVFRNTTEADSVLRDGSCNGEGQIALVYNRTQDNGVLEYDLLIRYSSESHVITSEKAYYFSCKKFFLYKFSFLGGIKAFCTNTKISICLNNTFTCDSPYSKVENGTNDPECVHGCPKDYFNDVGICTKCPPNSTSSKNSTNIQHCSCQPPYLKHPINQTFQCVAKCPRSWYSNSSSCVRCPGNSRSDEGSVSLVDCLCDPGYEKQEDSCTECPKNTFNPSRNATCKKCPDGSNSVAGSLNCTCSGGYERKDGACESCPANTFKPPTSDTCQFCPDHSRAPPASTQCTCNAGFERVPSLQDGKCHMCKEDTYRADSDETCKQCPQNSKSPANSTDISNCTCNSNFFVYTNKPGSNFTCVSSCPEDTFSKQVTCEVCPPNSTSLEGSTSIDNCTCNTGKLRLRKDDSNVSCVKACPWGMYASPSSTCVTCPSNTSSPVSLPGCVCDAGSYLSGTECKKCPVNSTSPTGTVDISGCVCDAGFYSSGTECKKCPVNSTSPTGTVDISGCVCDAGFYSSGTECKKCPVNSTSPTGMVEISGCVCNAGFYSSGTECKMCPVNSTSPTGTVDISGCVCDAGSYSSGTECKKCPVNSTSPTGTVDISGCICDAGSYLSDTECKMCHVNTYSTAGNACKSCPRDTFSPEGSTSISACVGSHLLFYVLYGVGGFVGVLVIIFGIVCCIIRNRQQVNHRVSYQMDSVTVYGNYEVNSK